MVDAVSKVATNSDKLESFMETTAENVYKRFKYTQTPLQSAHDFRRELLESSQLRGPDLVNDVLGDMPDTQALAAAAQLLKQQMDFCPVDGHMEEPIQKLVIKLFTDLHTGYSVHGSAALLVWDTHPQALAVNDSSVRAEPDMLLCVTYKEAANVVSVVVVTSTLTEFNNHCDVAYQLSQRVGQLQAFSAQPHFLGACCCGVYIGRDMALQAG